MAQCVAGSSPRVAHLCHRVTAVFHPDQSCGRCRSGAPSACAPGADRHRCETVTPPTPTPQPRSASTSSAAAAASRDLPIPGSPRNTTPGVANVPAWVCAQLFCRCATSSVAANQRTPPHPHRLNPLADDEMMGDRPVDAFDRSRRAATATRSVLRTSGSTASDTTTHPGGAMPDTRAATLTANPYTSSLGGVQIHQPAMYPNPHTDADP